QIDRRFNANSPERCRGGGVRRAFKPRLQLIDVDAYRLELPKQDQIVALTLVWIPPDDGLREDIEKCRDLALHGLPAALVQLDELRHDAARPEMPLCQLKEFAREQCGHT